MLVIFSSQIPVFRLISRPLDVRFSMERTVHIVFLFPDCTFWASLPLSGQARGCLIDLAHHRLWARRLHETIDIGEWAFVLSSLRRKGNFWVLLLWI